MQRSISFNCMSSTSSFLVLLIVVLTAVPAMFGQAYSGTVSGELTDATSAVVTGAKVILTDQEKGFNFQTTSDSTGGYLFRSIPPGVYVVSVEAAGFAKTESAKFKVDINENATANLTLKVAGATQTVEVGAQAQTIQTEDAETGQVVNRRFINDLPLLDRNIESLTSLAPGVTEMNDACPEPCIGTNFVSNGSRGANSDILLDGASAVLALQVAAHIPLSLLVSQRVAVAGDDPTTWIVVGAFGTTMMGVADKTTGMLGIKEVTISEDEGIRADTTYEGVSKIKPAMPGGVIAAGNASQFSDGASAAVAGTSRFTNFEQCSRTPIRTVIELE